MCMTHEHENGGGLTEGVEVAEWRGAKWEKLG